MTTTQQIIVTPNSIKVKQVSARENSYVGDTESIWIGFSTEAREICESSDLMKTSVLAEN